MHLVHSRFLVNSPAAQLMGAHELEPTLVVSWPLEQPVHLLAPAAEYEFFAHAEQALAPASAANWPDGHTTHWVPPEVALKVPEAQFVQKPAPAAEYVPGAQALQLVDPAAEKEPAAQVEHGSAVPGENLPTTQDEQEPAPSLTAYVPAAQLAHAADAPAVLEYLPAPQTAHLERPVELAKVPTAQAAQLVAPVDGANLPVAHAVHEMLPVSAA